MPKIRLRINYETQDEAQFQAFLADFKGRADSEFQQLKIERYWKFPEQLQAEIIISTTAQTNADRVYEILQLANQLSQGRHMGWTFNGPHDTMGLVFECFYNDRETGHPLKWAMIAVEED